MLVPNIDDINWIKGETKPTFGLLGYPDQLLLTSAQIDSKHASNCPQIFMDVWSYPIRTLAYLGHANLASSSRFEPHANRIAFRDESGFPAALKNRLGNPSVITPLFAMAEHQLTLGVRAAS